MPAAVDPCACAACRNPSVRNIAERELHYIRHEEFAAFIAPATHDPEPLPAHRQIEVIGQEFDPTILRPRGACKRETCRGAIPHRAGH